MTYLLAAPGLGKSYALQAVARRCAAEGGKLGVVVLSLRTLVAETCRSFIAAGIDLFTANDLRERPTIVRQSKRERVIVLGCEQFVQASTRTQLCELASSDLVGFLTLDEVCATHDALGYRDVMAKLRESIDALLSKV